MERPVRKKNRLTGFDYSTPNAYFITICTQQRRNLFGKVVGATTGRPPCVQLNACGEVVKAAVESIPMTYPAYELVHYVIMPNHVHLLLLIRAVAGGRPVVAPTVSKVIAQMKGVVTKRLGQPIWQKGFHDHVVRSEVDLRDIWVYIENNPAQWALDPLYTPS